MSTLVISNNKNKAFKYIKNIIEIKENKSINIFNNIDILYYIDDKNNLSTDIVRDLNIKIQDRNVNLSNKYLIISNFNRASKESQNAFLKTLEESNKEIFLVSSNKSGILDTIISRVFIIHLSSKKSYNRKIQQLLYKILVENDLKLIKELSIKYSTEKILTNFEYYLYKNPELKNRVGALNKIYLFKKRNIDIKLNNEIQLTNIIIGLLKN